MTKKHSTGNGRHSDSKRDSGGITGAFVDAAVEIGHAAENFKNSLRHVQKARQKGRRVIEPVRHAGKKAMSAVRRTISRRKGTSHNK